MFRKFIKFVKKDYNSVWFAMKELSNDRIPTWVIVLYWSLLAPIGLLLYPLIKLVCWIWIRRMLIKIKKGDEA